LESPSILAAPLSPVRLYSVLNIQNVVFGEPGYKNFERIWRGLAG
jgi:hypothetical protein